MAKIVSSSQIAAIHRDSSNLERIQKPPNAPPDTQWIGGYKVGVGGNGVATMWVLIDKSTHRAIHHVVIKDSFERASESTKETGLYKGIYRQLKDKGMDFGADPTHNIGHAAPEHRFLKEAYLQGLMTVPESSEEIYCNPLWGYARRLLGNPYSSAHNHWRLYMPLHDYGDLDNLIKSHYFAKKAIPEPFIWHTFICLMKAAVQLEERARSRPNNTDSDVIVVFDMKPGNILLAPPDTTKSFPIYPRPHLADLGGGNLTNKDDFENKIHSQHFAYTPGYMAPEMVKPSAGSQALLPNSVLRGTCTNVWQIGRVLEQMMKLRGGFPNIDYQPGRKEVDMIPQIIGWQGELPGQNYSMNLRRMVNRCLQFAPHKRPSPQNFLSYIDNPGHPLFQGMDTFGSDAWFQDQQQKRTAAGPKPKPKDLHEDITARAAEEEKHRRFTKARPYLRAWGPSRAAEFLFLDVFPPEELEVMYTDEANWWATDPQDLTDAKGKPVYPLPKATEEIDFDIQLDDESSSDHIM
ncbi:kinase-like protein, partial [Aureobasidium melanogenum]|uniref:Kinase-like protein n=1 Tax=Aureobasidium melanogenum (strain CBS 110374) TaxID=1043003 RepID=A0A074VLG6_AURM1